MTATHWTNAYVGTPYRDHGRDHGGIDCLGLLILIYDEQLQITLPDYTDFYVSASEAKEIDVLLRNAAVDETWRPVNGIVRPFDVAVFRNGPYHRHIGIVVSPGLMIHAPDDHTKIEHYQTGRWASRLVGIHRHASLTSAEDRP